MKSHLDPISCEHALHGRLKKDDTYCRLFHTVYNPDTVQDKGVFQYICILSGSRADSDHDMAIAAGFLAVNIRPCLGLQAAAAAVAAVTRCSPVSP